MNTINLTLHTIYVVDADNNVIKEYASEGIARVVTREERTKSADGVEVVRTVFGGVEGLPEPDGNIYIVSKAVELAVPQRTDVVAPDTGASSVKRRKYRMIEKKP